MRQSLEKLSELRHDVALETARICGRAVRPALLRAEHKDAVEFFYRTINAALQSYEMQRDAMRLQPSRN